MAEGGMTTHVTKSAVSHATVPHATVSSATVSAATVSSATVSSATPGRRGDRRTGGDSSHRGQRDHHLAHHDTYSFCCESISSRSEFASDFMSGCRALPRERTPRRQEAPAKIPINNRTKVLNLQMSQYLTKKSVLALPIL
jgi:hypothetical protein